jgi:hypothetical protein
MMINQWRRWMGGVCFSSQECITDENVQEEELEPANTHTHKYIYIYIYNKSHTRWALNPVSVHRPDALQGAPDASGHSPRATCTSRLKVSVGTQWLSTRTCTALWSDSSLSRPDLRSPSVRSTLESIHSRFLPTGCVQSALTGLTQHLVACCVRFPTEEQCNHHVRSRPRASVQHLVRAWNTDRTQPIAPKTTSGHL